MVGFYCNIIYLQLFRVKSSGIFHVCFHFPPIEIHAIPYFLVGTMDHLQSGIIC